MKKTLVVIGALFGMVSNVLIGTSSNLVAIDNKSGKTIKIAYKKFLNKSLRDSQSVVVEPGKRKDLSGNPIKISGPEWEHTWKKGFIPKEKELRKKLGGDSSGNTYKEYTRLTCGETVFDVRDAGSGEIQWRVGGDIHSFQKEKKKETVMVQGVLSKRSYVNCASILPS